MKTSPGLRSRAAVAAMTLVGAGLVLYWLSPVLFPFVGGFLVAYFLNPLVERLVRRKVPRALAVTLVFVLFSAALALVAVAVVSAADRQAREFAQNIPGYLERVEETTLPWIEQKFGLRLSLDEMKGNAREYLASRADDAGRLAAKIFTEAARSGAALAGWLAGLMLVPVVAFYLLCDWPQILAWFESLLPRAYAGTVVKLAKESDAVLASFLRGQVLVMAALALLYSTGLALVGVQPALPLGLFAGAVSFIPYLGLVLGGGAAVVMAAVQFQDWTHPLLAAGVFVAAQTVESTFLTPRLVGSRVQLHPIEVVFAVAAGGTLFGFTGLLLALPVAAVGKVWFRHALARYKESDFYAGDG